MIVSATSLQARCILGAMREVATTTGTTALGAADRAAISAAHRYVFKARDPLDVDTLPRVSPADLAGSLGEPALAQHAVRFAAVMALVDGRIDERKIAVVLRY